MKTIVALSNLFHFPSLTCNSFSQFILVAVAYKLSIYKNMMYQMSRFVIKFAVFVLVCRLCSARKESNKR